MLSSRTSSRPITSFLFAMLLVTASNAQTPPHLHPLSLWYRRPAAQWREAPPIGNGRLGAMVFGGANSIASNGDSQDDKLSEPVADGSHL